MQHLLTQITGLDMLLALAIFVLYLWWTPEVPGCDGGLDAQSRD